MAHSFLLVIVSWCGSEIYPLKGGVALEEVTLIQIGISHK